MKKFKLLPSILMLILCVGVLAVGIYAASPISHSVVGTVNISAGGANVSITGYLDDGDGDFTDDVKVTDTYTSRTAKTISIYPKALDFDCSSASDIAQVAEKKLYFKVENHSSFSLGAYFLEGTVPSGGTTSSNIAKNKNFNGTMGTETISNLITATFTLYSEVPANSSTNMYSTLKLNQLNKEASTVTLSLNLNIEKLNRSLIPGVENAIEFSNSGNITANCSIENALASTSYTKESTSNFVWEIGELAFAEDTFGGQLRIRPVILKVEIVNKNDYPISVSVDVGSKNTNATNIEVFMINNPYIAPDATGEVSVQFSAVYTRDSSGVATAPTISVYNYIVSINKVNLISDSYVYDLITYDNSTTENSMPSRGLHYYIEYGDNPYIAGEKLRWYVWAKDDKSNPGTPIALSDSDKITDSSSGTAKKKLAKGNKYYFISEYVLDVNDSSFGLSYQNEYTRDLTAGTNVQGDYCSDYGGSNCRNYLNGETVKASSLLKGTLTGTCYANGYNINFYDKFNLTNDILYSQISARSVESLYNDEGILPFPSKYADSEDKFWILSEREVALITNPTAFQLSSNDIGAYYWLRTYLRYDGVACIDDDGFPNECIIRNSTCGVRPAFTLAI